MFKRLVKTLTKTYDIKMVIIVRTDLKMGKGKIASQSAHAAVNLYRNALDKKCNTELSLWLKCGQPKVVLKIDNNCEAILADIYSKAKCLDVNACLICDAGKTQIDPGTLTVLGIGPDYSEKIDQLTADFKLL